MTEQRPDRPTSPPERPRVEPEIIPPGGAGGSPRRETSAVWISIGPDGAHRVQIGKPGFLSVVMLALVIAFVIAAAVFLLFGAVLVLVPVVPLLLGAGVVAGLWQKFALRR